MQRKEPEPKLADTELCPALPQPAVGLPQPWEPSLSVLRELYYIRGFKVAVIFNSKICFTN